ncbi:hypothetical protein BJ166DRAFT_603101 [Pestalotiopsis sp. NC0098]|nr:hypothetical protein BJ166DRAFT_603101 [Pestalotiopsis sp. NC0098]
MSSGLEMTAERMFAVGALGRDETSPICGQCSRIGRYCDRKTDQHRFVSFSTSERGGKIGNNVSTDVNTDSSAEQTISISPAPEAGRKCLERPDIASYFHHYIADIAPWYDLGDESRRSFALDVSRLALDQPLLLGAIIALSAIHVAQSAGNATARKTAELYHGHCVRSLIRLNQSSVLLQNGIALATTCLLRSYEILNEVRDPQRHLRGAYSLASHPGLIENGPSNELYRAGFWNYLREDITFSLFEGCPLKMNLSSTATTRTIAAARGPLDSISLLLGQIINAIYTGTMSSDPWLGFLESLSAWYTALPPHMHSFSTGTSATPSTEGPLPRSWFLQDTHASAMHYFLTSICLLTTCAPEDQLTHIAQLTQIESDEPSSKEDILETCSIQLCGIAFTTNTPSVLVNAFGPMFYCGRFIRQEAARQDIIRHLHACKKIVGWPVERIIDSLSEAEDEHEAHS